MPKSFWCIADWYDMQLNKWNPTRSWTYRQFLSVIWLFALLKFGTLLKFELSESESTKFNLWPVRINYPDLDKANGVSTSNAANFYRLFCDIIQSVHNIDLKMHMKMQPRPPPPRSRGFQILGAKLKLYLGWGDRGVRLFPLKNILARKGGVDVAS